MQDDTIKLLKEVDSGCKMAIDSIDRMEGFHMGPDMAHVTECYKQKHQALQTLSSEIGVSWIECYSKWSDHEYDIHTYRRVFSS